MLTDSKTGYGAISIVLHWLGALLIVAIWILGDRIEDAPAGPARLAAQDLHFGVAILAMAVLVPRLLWRFTHAATPMARTSVPALDVTAKIVKWGLLAAMTILLVSGPLDAWTGRRGSINVFGTIITSPIPASLAGPIHQAAGITHVICAKVILLLVALHVLGALKHLIFDRDGVFQRMLVPSKS